MLRIRRALKKVKKLNWGVLIFSFPGTNVYIFLYAILYHHFPVYHSKSEWARKYWLAPLYVRMQSQFLREESHSFHKSVCFCFSFQAV